MDGDELKTKKWMMLVHKIDLFMPTQIWCRRKHDWRLAVLVVRSRLYARVLERKGRFRRKALSDGRYAPGPVHKAALETASTSIGS